MGVIGFVQRRDIARNARDTASLTAGDTSLLTSSRTVGQRTTEATAGYRRPGRKAPLQARRNDR
jgi:hypothetical protein